MLNRIVLMGRLTRDPELRRTGSGTAVSSFSIVVDRDFKGQSGESGIASVTEMLREAATPAARRHRAEGSMKSTRMTASCRSKWRSWLDD